MIKITSKEYLALNKKKIKEINLSAA